MFTELQALFEDLDLDRLRLIKPSKFVFLCGGEISGTTPPGKAVSLRDYLYRVRNMSKHFEVVLAERANQLYRDTQYHDLISFEEDIAQIASVVLVISESAGSLAELGAFASSAALRPGLRVIIQEEFRNAESFVRYGPVERIRSDDASHVGFYPWRRNGQGLPVVASAQPHYRAMIQFIKSHIDHSPASIGYSTAGDVKIFYLVYWLIYLSQAISPTSLATAARLLIPNITDGEIRNKLFCMELAGWIARTSYSGRDFIYSCIAGDSIDYAFKSAVPKADRDSLRRRQIVSEAIAKAEGAPKHVKQVAYTARRSPL